MPKTNHEPVIFRNSLQPTQLATKQFTDRKCPSFRYLIRMNPPMFLRVACCRVLGRIAEGLFKILSKSAVWTSTQSPISLHTFHHCTLTLSRVKVAAQIGAGREPRAASTLRERGHSPGARPAWRGPRESAPPCLASPDRAPSVRRKPLNKPHRTMQG